MPAASIHPLTSQIIETEAQLRALIGEPAQLTCAKISDRLNSMTRLFVERSPFVCVATSDAAGNCDLSPRGGPAGFVRILDDRTLLIPERPGNRLADSLRDMLANPRVGLLFIVPGATDTFRVNGRATNPLRFVDPGTMPTSGQVHRAIQGEQFDAQLYDQERAERYRRRVGFY